MRPIYLWLKITLPLAYSVFFRRRKSLNPPNTYRARTIFVCNHPSAFLDPPMIATMGKPIVYFMTRSDVFKWWLKPVTWACHMVPIYRAEQDGAGTYEKNQEVFKGIRKVLTRRGSLIMFGEGYTDNVFVRSLKPMKKGPPRLGFGAMEATEWKQDIKIQAVGVNYTNPGYMRSDVLVSYGEPIPLKEYKEMYDENPNKAALQLMRRIGADIKANITYIEDKSKADFLEHILILSRKGMNHKHFDRSLSLEDRYRFSQVIANKINAEFSEESDNWTQLEEGCKNYFNQLDRKGIDEELVHEFAQEKSKNTLYKWIYLILTSPVFLLGFLHTGIPYILSKVLVEKMFKRKVFWSGVKLVLGGFLAFAINLPLFWMLNDHIYVPHDINVWVGITITFTYMFIILPRVFVFSHAWKRKLLDVFKIGKAKSTDLEQLVQQRESLKDQIEEMGF